MNLGTRKFTAGDARKLTINYDDWLSEGDVATAFTVTSDTMDIVVSSAGVNPTGTCSFLVSGGTIGELATLALTLVTSRSEVKHDTYQLQVVTP